MGERASHALTCNPACSPCRLEIEATGDPIYIQYLSRKVEAGTEFAFHRFKIHFGEPNAAAGDEFVFV
jgi:hypothetical protein